MAFEFRTYDPRVGRFLSVDPLAVTAPYQSGYLFAANNPILNIDYLGLVEKPKQGGKGKGTGARKGGGFWNKLFRRKVKQVVLKEVDMQEIVVTAKRPTKRELRQIARRRKRKEREAILAQMKSQQKDWVVEEYKPNSWAKMRDGHIGNQILYGTANAFYAGSQVWFTPHVVNLDNTMSLTPDERLGTAANFLLEVVPIGKAYTLAKPGIKVATSSGVRKAVVTQVIKKAGCFVEGTIVITADSSVAIDSIH